MRHGRAAESPRGLWLLVATAALFACLLILGPLSLSSAGNKRTNHKAEGKQRNVVEQVADNVKNTAEDVVDNVEKTAEDLAGRGEGDQTGREPQQTAGQDGSGSESSQSACSTEAAPTAAGDILLGPDDLSSPLGLGEPPVSADTIRFPIPLPFPVSIPAPNDPTAPSRCAAGPQVSAQAAQSPVELGTAKQFAVLAGSAVTNTGPSVVNGDLGTSPSPAVIGFPPGKVNGTIHAADAVAAQAQADLTTAYNDAAGRGPASTVPTELGGQTLTPGVYDSQSGTFAITGSLTLDAQGDPNAVFIFQADTTLITASDSRVILINGAEACNVFWQVGSSATLGTNSIFRGNILALTSISANTGATVHGRLLARNGAVTLDTNTVTKATCESGGGRGGGGGDGDGDSGDGDGDDGDDGDSDSDDGDSDDGGGDSDDGGGGGPSPSPTPISPGGPTASPAPTPVPTIELSVSPTPVVVGRRVRFVFRAVTYTGGVRRGLSGVSIFFGGRRVVTDRFGVATIVIHVTMAGVKVASATRPGMRPTTVRVVATRPGRVREPRFTG